MSTDLSSPAIIVNGRPVPAPRAPKTNRKISNRKLFGIIKFIRLSINPSLRTRFVIQKLRDEYPKNFILLSQEDKHKESIKFLSKPHVKTLLSQLSLPKHNAVGFNERLFSFELLNIISWSLEHFVKHDKQMEQLLKKAAIRLLWIVVPSAKAFSGIHPYLHAPGIASLIMARLICKHIAEIEACEYACSYTLTMACGVLLRNPLNTLSYSKRAISGLLALEEASRLAQKAHQFGCSHTNNFFQRTTLEQFLQTVRQIHTKMEKAEKPRKPDTEAQAIMKRIMEIINEIDPPKE
jgi:hypothetical protein